MLDLALTSCDSSVTVVTEDCMLELELIVQNSLVEVRVHEEATESPENR